MKKIKVLFSVVYESDDVRELAQGIFYSKTGISYCYFVVRYLYMVKYIQKAVII